MSFFFFNYFIEVEDITASNFMDKLDNGVIICKLARLIQQKAEECKRKGLITEVRLLLFLSSITMVPANQDNHGKSEK